jgi:hypothetical protein
MAMRWFDSSIGQYRDASTEFPLPVTGGGGGGSATEYSEDTAHVSGDKLIFAGVVRRDTATSGVSADGDRAVMGVNGDGRLWVDNQGSGAFLDDSGGDPANVAVMAFDVGSVATNVSSVNNLPVADSAALAQLNDLETRLGNLETYLGTNAASKVVGDTAGSAVSQLRGLNYLTEKFVDQTNGLVKVALELGLIKDNDEVSAARPNCTTANTTVTGTTATQLVAAPSAGNHLEIWRITVEELDTTENTVSWRDGSGGTDKYHKLLTTKGEMMSMSLNGSWHLTTATALYVKCSAAGSVRFSVEYRTVADSVRA